MRVDHQPEEASISEQMDQLFYERCDPTEDEIRIVEEVTQ